MKTAEIKVGEQYAAVTGYGNATSRYASFDRVRVEGVRVDRDVSPAWSRTPRMKPDGVRVTLLNEKTGRKMGGLRDGPERVIRAAQVGHLWADEVERRKQNAEAKAEREVQEKQTEARMKSIVDDLGELGIEVDWSPDRWGGGADLELSETAALQLEAVLREIVGGSDGIDHYTLAQVAAKAVPEDEWEES